MAKVEVGGFIRFIKCAQCAVDDVLVDGIYLGKAENQYGQFHKFRNHNGETVGLRGGHLDFLLEQGNVKERTPVEVIYKGSHILEDGPFRGKEAHRFAMFIEEAEVAPGAFNPNDTVDFDRLGEL